MRRHLAAELLETLPSKTVLVVGDLMLDEYLWGSTDRISPEAPVPVVQWERRTFAPGGAANVVRNVVSLGAHAVVGGVVGDDNSAAELRRVLAATGADLTGIVTAPGRLTTRKTRVFARSQQLLRVDRETADPLPDDLTELLTDRCLSALDSVDAVLFSDYAKGALSAAWTPQVIAAARKRGTLVTAGPKPPNVRLFHGAALVSFNRFEAEEIVGRPLRDTDSLIAAGTRLVADLQVDRLIITRGGEGALLFSATGVEQIPSKPVHVFDECGAGDTFLAAATLALVAGADFKQAARLAASAAAAVIQKVGVCPATPADVLELCPPS